MEISSIIGKHILSPAGNSLGYVKQLRLTRNLKKLACLICVDGDEEEFIVPARGVLSYSDVLIAGNGRLKSPTGVPCPVGLPVYSQTGRYEGTVCDMILDEGEPLFLIGQERTQYTLERIVIGESVILYGSEKEKRAALNKSARRNIQKEQTEAFKEQEEQTQAPMPVQQAPHNRLENRLNLLGKQIKKSVYDSEGSVLFAAGERITPALLNRAHREGRLLQLTVNTLTNIY